LSIRLNKINNLSNADLERQGIEEYPGSAMDFDAAMDDIEKEL
jgi:hypothetical protein